MGDTSRGCHYCLCWPRRLGQCKNLPFLQQRNCYRPRFEVAMLLAEFLSGVS